MAGGDPAPVVRRRIGLGAHVWWDAVTSGAFFSPAALWISILVAVTVLAPFQHIDEGAGVAHVVSVGFLGWAALAVLLVPVALAERRLRRASHRGILVLTPVLVLLSFFVAPVPMTLIFDPLLLGTLVVTTLLIYVIVDDGEANAFEGAMLLGLYAIVAAAVWWGPQIGS